MSSPDQARRDAYAEIYFLLPEGWMAGIPAFDAASQRWLVTAQAPEDPGRSGLRPSVTGEGDDGLAALEDLARRLRKLPGVQHRINDERRRQSAGAGSYSDGWLGLVGILFDGLVRLAELRLRADRLRALRARRRPRRQKPDKSNDR